MFKYFLLIRLDRSFDHINTDDCRNIITKSREDVNSVSITIDADEHIESTTDIEGEKTFIIFWR